jgi:hypothetical protein
MQCWKCNQPISEGPAKIHFRAACPHCGSDLHTCRNCRYHAPGKPNDCIVPGTESVRDREKANFCEEFKPSLGGQKVKEEGAPKKKFGSLFKEEKGS